MKVFGIVLPEGSIQDHLALEHTLLEFLAPETGILLFYTSKAAIVWGKHQNPWYEVPVDSLERSGVSLARRSSGGGTVYHDPGNLNYSFLLPRAHFSQDENLTFIGQVLSDLGLQPEIRPRGDIFVNGRKCSGNALWYQKDRVLHHGTLLIDADLDRLSGGLKGLKYASDLQLEGHWVNSNPAPVANLREFSPSLEGSHIIEAAYRRLGGRYAGRGDSLVEAARQSGRPKQLAAHYASWSWTFGKTGAFRCSSESPSPWRMEIEQGRIRTIERHAESGTPEILTAPRPIPFFGAASQEVVRAHLEAPEPLLWDCLEAAVPQDILQRSLKE